MTNIITRITDYLNRFMYFPDTTPEGHSDQATACALWAIHTFTFSDSFPQSPFSTPYLYVHSTGPRSGKTLLIDLLEPIVLNPERTINMSSSVMFRMIENVRPTLFYDEVDTIFDGTKNSEDQNIINGGYKPSGYVWRNVSGKDGPEPMRFRTFCPKLLAGIENGKLPETVLTRCVPIELRRATTVNDEGQIVAPDGSTREIHYSYLSEPEADQIVAEIEAFVANWKTHYVANDIPKPIPGLDPRRWEIIMPLIQVAKEAGYEPQAREILARLLAPKPEIDSQEILALRTIQGLYAETGTGKLHTATICQALGAGWNGKLIGKRLGRYIEGASTTFPIGNRQAKGYYEHQFTTAFENWL